MCDLGLLQDAADTLHQLGEEDSPLSVSEQRATHTRQLHQTRQGL